MAGFLGSGRAFARNIARAAERVRPVKRKRKRRGGENRPVGPKLVTGRGLARRRSDVTAPLRWIFYLALAGAGAWFLMRGLMGA